MAKRSSTDITDEMRARLVDAGLFKVVTSRWHQYVKDGQKGDNLKRALTECAPAIAKEFGVYDRNLIKEEGLENIHAKIVEDADKNAKILSGKRCSLTNSVEWAFVKASLGNAHVEDAPSDVAWSMYIQFRKSPSFLYDMAKVVFGAKAKKEGESDNHGNDGFDGDDEYNVLASLGGGAQ